MKFLLTRFIVRVAELIDPTIICVDKLASVQVPTLEKTPQTAPVERPLTAQDFGSCLPSTC